MIRLLASVLVVVGVLGVVGCGANPTIYEVKGKVTLGGKAYPRLLVYFRPVSGTSTGFNNGVGETDKAGNLVVKSTGGHGLQAGNYQVTFYCAAEKSPTVRGAKLTGDDKPDELGIQTVQLVPDSYLEGKARDSDVRFSVTSGVNFFEFDVPTK